MRPAAQFDPPLVRSDADVPRALGEPAPDLAELRTLEAPELPRKQAVHPGSHGGQQHVEVDVERHGGAEGIQVVRWESKSKWGGRLPVCRVQKLT